MKYDEYTIGQTVFISERSSKGLREETVQKLGREYVYITGGYRVRRGSPNLVSSQKGHTTYGRIYLDREEHAREVMDEKAWTRFCRDIRYARRPSNVDSSCIERVRAILGVPRSE